MIGDIHGCYDEVIKLLEHIEFDCTKDRLISVGDLVDRGPKSVDVLMLLNEPWFFSVVGNHDYMMIETILHHSRYNENTWNYNGGIWHFSVDDETLKNLCHMMDDNMTYVIVIGKGKNRVNIVHAELVNNSQREITTDADIDSWNFNEINETTMIWGRQLISSTLTNKKRKGLSDTYVGHTALTEIKDLVIDSHHYIDNGACYAYLSQNQIAHLKMVRLSDRETIIYSMMEKKVL